MVYKSTMLALLLHSCCACCESPAAQLLWLFCCSLACAESVQSRQGHHSQCAGAGVSVGRTGQRG